LGEVATEQNKSVIVGGRREGRGDREKVERTTQGEGREGDKGGGSRRSKIEAGEKRGK
jgi:hypothetical protein